MFNIVFYIYHIGVNHRIKFIFLVFYFYLSIPPLARWTVLVLKVISRYLSHNSYGKLIFFIFFILWYYYKYFLFYAYFVFRSLKSYFFVFFMPNDFSSYLSSDAFFTLAFLYNYAFFLFLLFDFFIVSFIYFIFSVW